MKLNEKYDLVIENLCNKSISCDDLISHLKTNRFSSKNEPRITLNDLTDDLNCSMTDKTKLDNKINSNFVSYFLTLIHEEANRHLPLKNTANNPPILNNHKSSMSNFSTPPNSKVISLNQSSNTENIFDSTLSNANTPHSNFKNRKIILQPLPSNSSRNSTTNSPVDQNLSYSKTSNFKRYNTFAGSSNSSPTIGTLSPHNGQNNTPPYLSKLNNKATLFDFITTPNKSPSHQKPSHSQTLINDFKNRFIQHQNKMQNQQTTGQVKKTPQSPLIIQPNMNSPISENDQNTEINHKNNIQKNQSDEQEKKKDYSKLGDIVKNSLKTNELLKISILSDFYCQLILNNFTLTLNTELFFLFQLLTLNSIEDKSNCNTRDANKFRIFLTIESCIFFAIKSISNLECIIKYLKISTLNELNENIYMKSFEELFNKNSPIFQNECSKEEIKQKSKLVFFDLKVVPFNTDTNGRLNFPDKQFLVSCKNQRDKFYDILWNWEKNHCLENWNFGEFYGEKIRNLVTCNDSLPSFFEFVKLFLDQLVLMCKDDKMIINQELEEQTKKINGFSDPMKLKKLNARMSTPDPHYGPNPAPKFIGYQEFFKEFIDISGSPKFHQCLKDCIANEIEIIHREIPDLEEKNSFEKDALEEILLKLKVLGKFFGYLVFYSYQYHVPSYFLKDLESIRNKQLMPVNLQAYLERALIKKHLILTVPFVVEFLSMMDENAYLIESIQKTFNLLIMIYNSKFLSIKSNEFTIDKLLLLLKIAWLLQLKKIPIYQIEIEENYSQDNKVGVDDFSFITPLLLHFCCPYLDELQKLLTRFSSGVKRAAQKIKDNSHLFSVELVGDQPNRKLNFSDIQMKLVSQFLMTHPSIKKIIDFISETVFVSFIKNFRQNNLKIITDQLNIELSLISDEKKNDIIEYENILKNLSKTFADKTSADCVESGKKFLKSKIEILISNHLENTSSEQAIKISSQIALFKSIEKLKQWVDSNFTEKIFYEEIKLKRIKKKIEICETLTLNMEGTIDNDLATFSFESLMPSEIFNIIKNIQKKILTKEVSFFVIQTEISNILQNIQHFISNNIGENKLIKSVKLYLAQLSYEIILLLMMNYSDTLIEKTIIENYVNIQKTVDKSENKLIVEWLENPRNLFMIKKNSSSNMKINFKNLIEKIIENLNLSDAKLDKIMTVICE